MGTSLNAYIDLYCERTSGDFLNEPFNVLSNAFFLISAFYLYAARKKTAFSGQLLFVALIASIGIGSALFHIFALRWALVLDVFPIVVFQPVYLCFFIRRATALSRRMSYILPAVLLALIAASSAFPRVLNGSLPYFPALLFLSVMGVHAWRRYGDARICSVAGVFFAALVFRTADLPLCAYGFYPGTHFVWHVLTAAALHVLALFLSKSPVQKETVTGIQT